MKGKIAFVVGAAVGYVLGSRAGRQRYEQIKRGAQAVWQTEPVQRGVGLVRSAIDDRADDFKAYVRRASSDAFTAFARRAGGAGTPSETAASDRTTPADPGPVGAEAAEASTEADSAKSKPAKRAASAQAPKKEQP